jgi:hypothetical protein
MISLIKHSLSQFWLLFGFSPNHDKSSMFLCGVKLDIKTLLFDVLDYKERKLSIKYLGIPLITTITFLDYLILVDHIMVKAIGWMNHTFICE